MSKYAAIQVKLAAMREAQDARKQARTFEKAVQAYEAARYQSTMQRLEPVHAYTVLQYCTGDDQLCMARTCRAWQQHVNDPRAPRNACARRHFQTSELYFFGASRAHERVGTIHLDDVNRTTSLDPHYMASLRHMPRLTELRTGIVCETLPSRLVSLVASSSFSQHGPATLIDACIRVSTLTELDVLFLSGDQRTIDFSPLRQLHGLHSLAVRLLSTRENLFEDYNEYDAATGGAALYEVLHDLPTLRKITTCQYKWTKKSLTHALLRLGSQLNELSLHCLFPVSMRKGHLKLTPGLTRLHTNKVRVSPETLMTLLPQLTSLNIDARFLTSSEDAHAATNIVMDQPFMVPCLQRLRVMHVGDISDAELTLMIGSMVNVRVVDLSHIQLSFRVIEEFAKCKQLTRIILPLWIWNTTDKSQSSPLEILNRYRLAHTVSLLSACSSLRTLELAHQHYTDARVSLVFAEVVNILQAHDASMWRDIELRIQSQLENRLTHAGIHEYLNNCEINQIT
jgi:hypothetical protein